MIKIISFDFWDTLFQGNDENSSKRTSYRIDILHKYLSKKGFNLSYDAIRLAIKKSWKYFEYIWITLHRTLTTKELILFILNELDINQFAKEEINKLALQLSEVIIMFPPQFTEPELPEILKELSKKYKLAIISDTGFSNGKTLRKFLKSQNIFQFFSKFSFSDELNYAKPHKKVYFNILENENPSNLIHIGDLLETDIKGAKKIGAYAVLYNGKFKKMELNRNKLSKTIEYTPDFSINTLNKLPKIVESI